MNLIGRLQPSESLGKVPTKNHAKIDPALDFLDTQFDLKMLI